MLAEDNPESEGTNKVPTMPSVSDQKNINVNGNGYDVAQFKASPVSQKKVQLHDAVMKSKNGSNGANLLQMFKKETPKKGSHPGNSQRSNVSANKNSALKQGSLLNFVKK